MNLFHFTRHSAEFYKNFHDDIVVVVFWLFLVVYYNTLDIAVPMKYNATTTLIRTRS